MNFVTLSSVLIPVMTGLGAALYAQLVASGPGGMWLATLANALYPLVVMLGLRFIGVKLPAISANILTLFVIMVAVYASISAFWLYPLANGASFTSLSLTEIAWPIFTVIFGCVLFGKGWPNLYQLAGGILAISGSCIVVFGEAK